MEEKIKKLESKIAALEEQVQAQQKILVDEVLKELAVRMKKCPERKPVFSDDTQK
jgi:hypothetical protein